MEIAITLRGFNDLGRSVIPIFLSMAHFPYRFFTICEKKKKIYRVEVLIFFQVLRFVKMIQYLKLLTPQIPLYKILLG